MQAKGFLDSNRKESLLGSSSSSEVNALFQSKGYPIFQDSFHLPLQSSSKESSFAAPSETELTEFFISINKCSSKPAILSLIPDHADSYVPKSLSPELPDVLSNLYDEGLANADYPEVRQILYFGLE